MKRHEYPSIVVRALKSGDFSVQPQSRGQEQSVRAQTGVQEQGGEHRPGYMPMPRRKRNGSGSVRGRFRSRAAPINLMPWTVTPGSQEERDASLHSHSHTGNARRRASVRRSIAFRRRPVRSDRQEPSKKRGDRIESNGPFSVGKITGE